MSEISYGTYLQLKGLWLLKEDHKRAVEQIEKQVAGLLGVETDSYGYYGIISDDLWGNDPIERTLGTLEITVADPE